MSRKTLMLGGVEAVAPILSRRVGDAAPCQLLGVVRKKPTRQLLASLAEDLDGGSISGLAVFDVPDISFLREFPTLRYLELRSSSKIDVSPLAQLDNLRGLHLEKPGGGLDFSAFPHLEEFVGDWHPHNTGLERASLRVLRVWGYKPKANDLRDLANLRDLATLSVIQTSITSLAGVESLEDLRELTVAYAPKLTSIEALGSLGIREIDFERLKAVNSYQPLARLAHLKKLKLTGCAPIPDLKWISEHPRLAFFSFVDTDLVSGDMTPLLSVPRLRYVGTLDKRHYSHKSDALNEQLKGTKRVTKTRTSC